jgi:hypothetical protein
MRSKGLIRISTKAILCHSTVPRGQRPLLYKASQAQSMLTVCVKHVVSRFGLLIRIKLPEPSHFLGGTVGQGLCSLEKR